MAPFALSSFFANGQSLAFITNAPFMITWTNAIEGAYALTAVATDGAGAASTSAPVNIMVVTNLPPTVSITSPRTNNVFNLLSNIVITANAADPDGTLRRVEFYHNSIHLGDVTASPYTYTWSNLVAGIQILTAVAVDGVGATRTSAPVRVSVLTNIPPTV